MSNILQKINNFLFHDPPPTQWMKTEEAKKFLAKFKYTDDYYKRSYYQYKAYKKIHGELKIFVLNIISFFVLPAIFLFYFIYSIFNTNHKNNNSIEGKTAFSFTPSDFGVIPDSLSKEFLIDYSTKNSKTDIKDFSYLFILIWKFPFSCFFVLRNFIHLIKYSSIIKQSNYKAIITNSEYSFSSSFLTQLCQNKGIEHINVMHGEKLFYIRDSFFAFHRCYVWDKYYADLFIELKAKKEQFIVELPPVLSKFIDLKTTGDRFVYYLQGMETTEDIKLIKKYIFEKTKINPVFRLHPRYSKPEVIKQCKDIDFENPNEINFEDSFKSVKYVCTKYSTLLYQAYLAKKTAIIDDISDVKIYETVKNLKYMMNYKEHIKLSEVGEKLK